MTAIAIRVEHLSKLYHIGRAQQRHDTLRDAIADFRLRISDLMKRNPTSLRCGDNCPQSTIRNPQSDDLFRITEPTGGRAPSGRSEPAWQLTSGQAWDKMDMSKESTH